MGILLKQSTYFFQAVEAQVNLIWWKLYPAPYQKHHFFTVKAQEKLRVLLTGPTGISAMMNFELWTMNYASIDLWIDIDSNLGEIFMMIPEKQFSGFSVIGVANLL